MREAYLGPSTPTRWARPSKCAKAIDLVRANKILVVFSESTISDRAAKQVANDTGAHYGGVLYVDSPSAADGPVPTFLDLLNVTVETIAKEVFERDRRFLIRIRSDGAAAVVTAPLPDLSVIYPNGFTAVEMPRSCSTPARSARWSALR